MREKKQDIIDYKKGTRNPLSLFTSAKYRKQHKREIFPYYGIRAYMGAYGSGKTLSAVKETIEILTKYPKATFVTNTSITGIRNKTYEFHDSKELIEILLKIVDINNQNGYVILIDEIHVVFKDIFTKYEDNDFITFLSQLRKLGMYIIGTAQLFSRCPKVVREYLLTNGNIVLCARLIKGTTLLKYVDMSTAQENNKNKLDAEIEKTEILFHTPELYQAYDTFAVVSQIKSLIKKENKNNEQIVNEN